MAAKTPEDCDRLFGEHLNAGDAAAVAALYEPQGVLVMGAEHVTGHAAIKHALDAFVAMKPTIQMNVTAVVRSGDIAVLYNDWSLTGTGPDGSKVKDSGRAIEIVRRQADGTWRFVIDDPRARG